MRLRSLREHMTLTGTKRLLAVAGLSMIAVSCYVTLVRHSAHTALVGMAAGSASYLAGLALEHGADRLREHRLSPSQATLLRFCGLCLLTIAEARTASVLVFAVLVVALHVAEFLAAVAEFRDETGEYIVRATVVFVPTPEPAVAVAPAQAHPMPQGSRT